MQVIPDSAVTLYSGIKIDVGQEVIFQSRQQQQEYFSRHALLTVPDCTYLRKEGSIQLEIPLATAYQANFLSFVNPSFESRVWYARIDDYEYINNSTTAITYTLDLFQSYMFDASYEKAYIERETLSQDGKAKETENPYRNDVVELLTAEPLQANQDLERPITGTARQYSPEYDNLFYMVLAPFDTKDLGEGWTTALSLIDNVYPTGFSQAYPQTVWVFVWRKQATESEEGVILRVQDFLDYCAYNLLTQSVLGLYYAPATLLRSLTEASTPPQFPTDPLTIEVTPDFAGLNNKKLARFPFQYLRAVTPDGTAKEYRFDDFINLINNTGNAQLRLMGTMHGVPVISCIPYKYKSYTTEPNDGDWKLNMNFQERLDHDNIPQLGYSTDSFLTYIGSQYASVLAEPEANEADYHQTRKDFATATLLSKGLTSPITQSAGTPQYIAGLAQGGAATLAGSGAGYIAEQRGAAIRAHQRMEAYGKPNQTVGAIAAIGDGDRPTSHDSARGLYVADAYTPGTVANALPYYLNNNRFRFDRVQLREEILQEYDRWLTYYGYASGRTGTPRVCNYINGNTDAAMIPYFDATLGDPATYVITTNFHVTGVPMPVADYIEALFNSGCRFLKGDVL